MDVSATSHVAHYRSEFQVDLKHWVHEPKILMCWSTRERRLHCDKTLSRGSLSQQINELTRPAGGMVIQVTGSHMADYAIGVLHPDT